MFRLLALCAMVVVFPCTAAVQDAAETNNYAAVKVYGEVMKKEGNILYSPYSFMSAMGTAT